MKKEFYSPQELAELLGVNYRTILKEIERGNLTAFKVGCAYRVKREELEKFIKLKTLKNKGDK